MNNLAYLLLTNGGDVNEARSLARRAVELEPRNASFHDTLARIHLKSGDREAALKSFEQALASDPSSLDALIGKASTLSAMGDRDQVRKLLIQVDALLKGGAQIAEPLQRELELARNGLNASIDPR
jgi:Tfp pilus assembly protein PilF